MNDESKPAEPRSAGEGEGGSLVRRRRLGRLHWLWWCRRPNRSVILRVALVRPRTVANLPAISALAAFVFFAPLPCAAFEGTFVPVAFLQCLLCRLRRWRLVVALWEQRHIAVVQARLLLVLEAPCREHSERWGDEQCAAPHVVFPFYGVCHSAMQYRRLHTRYSHTVCPLSELCPRAPGAWPQSRVWRGLMR